MPEPTELEKLHHNWLDALHREAFASKAMNDATTEEEHTAAAKKHWAALQFVRACFAKWAAQDKLPVDVSPR